MGIFLYVVFATFIAIMLFIGVLGLIQKRNRADD